MSRFTSIGGRLFAAAAMVAVLGASAAEAADPDSNWYLQDTGFAFAGTVTGTFSVSATTGEITNWDFTTSTDPGFTGTTYTPADSIVLENGDTELGPVFAIEQDRTPSGKLILASDANSLLLDFDRPFADALQDSIEGSPDFLGNVFQPITECKGQNCLFGGPVLNERVGCNVFGCPIDEGVAYPVPATPPTAAVPEPAAWSVMLVGFGAIGSAMRRRRSLSAVRS